MHCSLHIRHQTTTPALEYIHCVRTGRVITGTMTEPSEETGWFYYFNTAI